MCEMLIKVVDAVHPDSIIDAKFTYKRGDAVVINPDGWPWGSEESREPKNGGKFIIIKIPGADYIIARKYIESASSLRRIYRVVIDELPISVRNALNNTGTYTTNWNSIRGFIENKQSSVRESL